MLVLKQWGSFLGRPQQGSPLYRNSLMGMSRQDLARPTPPLFCTRWKLLEINRAWAHAFRFFVRQEWYYQLLSAKYCNRDICRVPVPLQPYFQLSQKRERA